MGPSELVGKFVKTDTGETDTGRDTGGRVRKDGSTWTGPIF